MPITPLEISHKEFKRSLRGYSETEVQEYLRELSREHERLLGDIARMKEERYGLQQRMKQYEKMEETLQKTLVMAQQAADAVRTNAQHQAEVMIAEAERQRNAILDDARNRARQIELEAAQVRAQADRFDAELRALLNAQEELLDRLRVSKDDPPSSGPRFEPSFEVPASDREIRGNGDPDSHRTETARQRLINWEEIESTATDE